MKPGILCIVLLAGCNWLVPDPSPHVREYGLTWTCESAEGCERMAEVERIDLMECVDFDCYFRSTQDDSFEEDARVIDGNGLPSDCSWLYFVSLFGHDLERSPYCFTPAGFELQLSIPNQDPTTYSMWVVDGRLADL